MAYSSTKPARERQWKELSGAVAVAHAGAVHRKPAGVPCGRSSVQSSSRRGWQRLVNRSPFCGPKLPMTSPHLAAAEFEGYDQTFSDTRVFSHIGTANRRGRSPNRRWRTRCRHAPTLSELNRRAARRNQPCAKIVRRRRNDRLADQAAPSVPRRCSATRFGALDNRTPARFRAWRARRVLGCRHLPGVGSTSNGVTGPDAAQTSREADAVKERVDAAMDALQGWRRLRRDQGGPW
jgi:hypothetical protein